MIWTKTLRCLTELELTTVELMTGELAAGELEEPEEDGTDPRRTGGVIFSNVKAGMAYPLGVELRHSLKSPLAGIFSPVVQAQPIATAILASNFTRTKTFNHSLEQLQNFLRIAPLPPRT